MFTSTLCRLVAAAVLMLCLSESVSAQERGIQLDPDAPLIQIRLAREAPTPGFSRMEFLNSDSLVYVDQRSIIRDDDITAAHAERSPGGLVVVAQLTQDGAARIEKATSSHVGDRLAVLVGSHLVSAPVIVDPVAPSAGTVDSSARTVELSLNLPDAAAKDVAAAVAARWKQ